MTPHIFFLHCKSTKKYWTGQILFFTDGEKVVSSQPNFGLYETDIVHSGLCGDDGLRERHPLLQGGQRGRGVRDHDGLAPDGRGLPQRDPEGVVQRLRSRHPHRLHRRGAGRVEEELERERYRPLGKRNTGCHPQGYPPKRGRRGT